MRVSLIISILLHAAVIAATVIVLPRTGVTPVDLPPLLPVELIKIADETNIAPAFDRPEASRTPGQEVIEEDPEAEPVPVEEPTPEPEPELEPEPAPAPEPEPAPAPPAPAPPAPPLPAAPPPVETVEVAPAPLNPDDALEPIDVEPEPPQTPPEDLARARPEPRPVAPMKTEETDETEETSDFFDELGAVLDKTPMKEEGRKFHQQAKPARGEDAAKPMPDLSADDPNRFNPELTVNEMDAIRAQLKPCWSPPAGAPKAEELIVVLRVRFQPDGNLIGWPEVVEPGQATNNRYLVTAANAAVRAVIACAPFDLPADRYRNWQTVELKFDPRFLLGL